MFIEVLNLIQFCLIVGPSIASRFDDPVVGRIDFHIPTGDMILEPLEEEEYSNLHH